MCRAFAMRGGLGYGSRQWLEELEDMELFTDFGARERATLIDGLYKLVDHRIDATIGKDATRVGQRLLKQFAYLVLFERTR